MVIGRRFWAAALAGVLLVGGATGCDKIADIAGKKAKEAATKELEKAANGGVAEGEGLFVDASAVPIEFKEKVGGTTRVLEMLVYPGWAKAQIQDPNKKLNVDEYEFRGGSVGDSIPVKFIGNKPTEASLATATFDITELDMTQVPKMVADAPVQLKLEGGKVTHMIVKRWLPFHKNVHWRVYVNGTRGNGSVEYDLKGAVKKVWE